LIAGSSYEFRQPGRLRVGLGASAEIPDLVGERGARRVLLVTDANCARIPGVVEMTRSLARRFSTSQFDRIPGEPTTADVAAGLVERREHEAEIVVGIGGGAVLDTAKAIAAMANHHGSIVDYVGRDRFTRPRLPLILVPTTAGTGSEATRYTVIADPKTNVKMLITDWILLPDVAIVDAALMAGAPPPVTAAAGIDALTHAIEAYVSQRHQPTADVFALGAIRQLAPNLAVAWANGADLAARSATAIGALHAGVAFCNASVGLVHGMSRPIGAHFHVAHGLANAMLLPAVTAWSIEGAPDRYADVASALGLGSVGKIPEALAALARTMQVPRLADVIEPARLRAVARQMAIDALASGSPANNPRVPSEDEIVALYDACLAA
jgi:alcohol dehydrogenase